MSISTGLEDIWHKAKAHPNIAAGVVFIVGAILVYWYYSGSAAPAQGDPNAANAAANAANEATQAQYAATLSGQQTAAQSVATQVNGQVSIATLNAGVAKDQIASTGSVQSQSILAGQSVDLASIDAGRIINEASLATVSNLAAISADVQKTQYADLFGYLNNEVTSQYGYLNHQIDANAANATTNRILQEQGQYIGNLGTALGKLGVNVPA